MSDAAETSGRRADESDEQARIARRAFELSLTDGESTPEENWLRAERAVRAESALSGQAL